MSFIGLRPGEVVRVGSRSTQSRGRVHLRPNGLGRPVSFSSTRGNGSGFDRSPISKGLILAQNERWRRGLGMQVERPARGVAQG
jgi:hypothetical protein